MSSNPGEAPAADAEKKKPEQQEQEQEESSGAEGKRELTDEEVAERHRAWMEEHGRVYADEAERGRRLGIFRDNLRHIEAHNRGGHSYSLGLNQFADLTNDEFRSTYCGGFRPPTPADLEADGLGAAHRPAPAAPAPPQP